GVRNLAQLTRMVEPERADADDADSNGHQITSPRSLASKKRRNSWTSGNGCSSAAAFSRACDKLSSDLKKRRYARFSSRRTSSGKPFRSKPTEFSPKSLIGFPTAFTKGATSFGTREQPPMKLYLPIFTN